MLLRQNGYVLLSEAPPFNLNSNVGGDDAITILNVAICTSHYAQTYP